VKVWARRRGDGSFKEPNGLLRSALPFHQAGQSRDRVTVARLTLKGQAKAFLGPNFVAKRCLSHSQIGQRVCIVGSNCQRTTKAGISFRKPF
jgi:hypothetical protein